MTPAGTPNAPGAGGEAPLTRDDSIEERAPEIIRRLTEAYPDAKVALHFTNPLEMLIATVLSAQCTDEKVNEVTATLFRKYRRPEDYLAAPEEDLRQDIYSTGFYNQKAKAIRGISRMLVEEFDGRVPDTMEDLVKLPGVARKTANIVLGNAFGTVVGVAVDTHVRRLANRLGFSTQKDADKVERDLMRLIPSEDWFPFTYVLIEHGRAVCQAKLPKCGECVVNDLCPSSLV